MSTPPLLTETDLARELYALVGKLRRRLREQSNPGELTPSQLSAIGRMDRDGPATVTTLAKAEGVRPQSMGATIAVLEAAGLVAGSPNPNDGRQTILSLTDRGRETIATGRAAREDWLSRAIQTRYSNEERELLAHAIPLLDRLTEPREVTP